MQKVKCKKCGRSGYTASPGSVRCKCGGIFTRSLIRGGSLLRDKENLNLEQLKKPTFLFAGYKFKK